MTRNMPLTVGLTAVNDPNLARGLGEAVNFLLAGGQTVHLIVQDGTAQVTEKIQAIVKEFVNIADPENKLKLEVNSISGGKVNTSLIAIRSKANSDATAPRDDE